MTISVTLAGKEDKQIWTDFVEKNAPDTNALTWAWKDIIETTFSHKAYFFIAKDKDQQIVAVCPAFHFKSPIFGNSLISVPYITGGGILATSETSFNAILDKLNALSKDLGCSYLELRHREPYNKSWSDENITKENTLVHRQHKVSMLLQLPTDSEALFAGFPAKLRSQIRRPTKSGLEAKISSIDLSVEESIDAFYQVFTENMRDLGTPVYPKKFFETACKAFDKRSRIITIWDKEKPVASGITLAGAKTVEIPWASSLRSYGKQSANMLLYWKIIETACKDGYAVFDFGRSSRDAGTFKFKKQWGSEPLELNWYYQMNKGQPPEVNPKDSKFSLMVNAWQKLPLPISNRLGPVLTRWIP